MKILIKQQLSTAAAILAVSILGLSSQPALANSQLQRLDQIVAIVDDDVLLASEVRDRMIMVTANIEKSGQPAPPQKEIQQQVIDQLILENIQLQLAYRAGVRISDAQLNDSMQRIAQQNGMNLVQFKEALESEGQSYAATREQIRKELTLQRVQQGNVNQRVQITDQEIANFLESEEGSTLTAPEFRMLHTLIPVSGDANASVVQAAKSRADALFDRIQKGEAYETVMASEQLAANDLGWRKADAMPSLIAELTANLASGETATPVKSASGFHLVKLLDKRGEGETIPQTKARHILLKPSAIRNEAATQAEATALRQRIIDGESFEELARQYSEDIGSAVEGGDLGWTNPGQLVGEFQKTMDNTEIDGISPAFKSQFGWHILQVLGRRDKDVTDDIRRNIARNYIHQRKFDDELQSWLQKIRDEAYVDFK